MAVGKSRNPECFLGGDQGQDNLDLLPVSVPSGSFGISSSPKSGDQERSDAVDGFRGRTMNAAGSRGWRRDGKSSV